MLYDIGFFIFSIFYLPVLIFKGKLHDSFGERFGRYPLEKLEALKAAKDVIWIQAVSVGEVALCKSLIPVLREKLPHCTIVFSTITKTGNDMARRLFSKDAIVIYFPLDFSFITKKVTALIRPKVYVMIETEIWPNLLKALCARRTHSIMINGRISDRSYGKYKLARPFLASTLSGVDAFCMQSQVDADRIISLGAAREKVCVAGSMKFDSAIIDAPGLGAAMKESLGLGAGEELFVAGSTHRGEEAAVLSVFKRLTADFPKLRLLIAPRHIERSDEVDRAVSSAGLGVVRVSSLDRVSGRGAPSPVFILDTIGRLNEAFSLATIVFMGGSLVRRGGQNPIEPAALGKSVLFGPYMFNFKNVVKILLDNDAAVQVQDERGLYSAAATLLKDKNRMRDLGWNAKRAVTANRGATGRSVEAILRLVYHA